MNTVIERTHHGVYCEGDLAPALLRDAAISDMERYRTNGLSVDATKPCFRQKSAASSSSAFTSNARPPTKFAPSTERHAGQRVAN
jgi:hypothetical protein